MFFWMECKWKTIIQIEIKLNHNPLILESTQICFRNSANTFKLFEIIAYI